MTRALAILFLMLCPIVVKSDGWRERFIYCERYIIGKHPFDNSLLPWDGRRNKRNPIVSEGPYVQKYCIRDRGFGPWHPPPLRIVA